MTLLSIGDFSTMTYLSVKTLRHYHETGVLLPAAIDPVTGFRRYRPDQVPTAQVIRRLRELDMPLEQIRAVLSAPDIETRNAGISAHLKRMEVQLDQTRAAVASLRNLLHEPSSTAAVEYRTTDPTPVLALRAEVTMADAGEWWETAFDHLHARVAASGSSRTGPDGALYPQEFFQTGRGQVTAFVPIRARGAVVDGLELLELPRSEYAVAVHVGAFSDLDRAYGALGGVVAERAIGVDGPIRENYLVTPDDTDDAARHRTEVCWPVFLTATRRSP